MASCKALADVSMCGHIAGVNRDSNHLLLQN
jgi:hypothetical protein